MAHACRRRNQRGSHRSCMQPPNQRVFFGALERFSVKNGPRANRCFEKNHDLRAPAQSLNNWSRGHCCKTRASPVCTPCVISLHKGVDRNNSSAVLKVSRTTATTSSSLVGSCCCKAVLDLEDVQLSTHAVRQVHHPFAHVTGPLGGPVYHLDLAGHAESVVNEMDKHVELEVKEHV